jgi:sulfur-oxidizing protein SoxY
LNPHRRHLLRAAVAPATLAVAAAAGLLRPEAARAAPRARTADKPPRDPLQEALRAMHESRPEDSPAIQLKAPEIAEDGANVFIEFSTTLPEVDTLAVFVEENPQRLAAAFRLEAEVVPGLQLRIKVARTSRIWVVARSGGRFYKAIREVKVTVGGCGLGAN